MADRWAHDPQYSHGFVVPIFALIVLWSRREMLKRTAWQPSWLGLALMALGVVLRIIAVESDIEPLDTSVAVCRPGSAWCFWSAAGRC